MNLGMEALHKVIETAARQERCAAPISDTTQRMESYNNLFGKLNGMAEKSSKFAENVMRFKNKAAELYAQDGASNLRRIDAMFTHGSFAEKLGAYQATKERLQEANITDLKNILEDSNRGKLERSCAKQSLQIDLGKEEALDHKALQNQEKKNINSNNFPNKLESRDCLGYLESYDNSKEAQELRMLGVPKVDLRDCKPEYRREIVSAVKDAFAAYPKLREQLSEIICTELDGSYADYGPISSDVPFGGRLRLNSKDFSSDFLQTELSEASTAGFFTPNRTPRSTVLHELGHGMHLDLCAQSCGLKYGEIPKYSDFENAVHQYLDNKHADKIVQDACAALNIEFDSCDFASSLSGYAAADEGEALAEAVAEALGNENPRPLAQEIYSNLLNYKERYINATENS